MLATTEVAQRQYSNLLRSLFGACVNLMLWQGEGLFGGGWKPYICSVSRHGEPLNHNSGLVVR